ncbi:MAG: hypothetical protein J5800_01310, partial [Spirochaetales bacterium]|nr:hypothetical protein [Spirochaetales bacterium]
MKKTIIVILSLLLVAGFAFAGGSDEKAASTSSEPVYKESIVLGDGSQITTGDPQSINNMQHNRIFKCSHNTLVSYNSAT